MQIIITKKEFNAGAAANLKLQLLAKELGLGNRIQFDQFELIATGSPRKGITIERENDALIVSFSEDFVIDSIDLSVKISMPYIKMIAAFKLAISMFKIDVEPIKKKVTKFQKKWN